MVTKTLCLEVKVHAISRGFVQYIDHLWQFVEINHEVVFDLCVYKWLGFNHNSYIMFKLLIVLLLNQSRYNT